MAAAPDDDARRTLAELEVKLRDLERELLHGRSEPLPAPTEVPEIPGFEAAAQPPPPAGQAELFAGAAPEEVAPAPAADPNAPAEARELLDGLRETLDALSEVARRIGVQARALVDDHGRALARLDRAASAAARAEEAAAQAGRLAGTVVVEAGPFADAGAVAELRDALAAQPAARDAYVRGVEDGRAVIEVHLRAP
jgi:hypothetical protein